MNEINIYSKFKYRKMLKSASRHFSEKYSWYNPKKIFAPQEGNYTVSIRKKNIRICYWDENSIQGRQSIEMIKNFIKDNFNHDVVGITSDKKCNIFDDIDFVKIKYIQSRG